MSILTDEQRSETRGRSVVARLSESIRAHLELKHLQAWENSNPDDEAAFREWRAEVTTSYALIASSLQALVTLLWWPVDYLVATSPQYLPSFAAARVSTIALEATIFFAFLWSGWVRRHALIAAPIGFTLIMGLFGYHLGTLAGPDKPWFADAIIGILPMALVPLALGPRVAATGALGLALGGCYFYFHPEHLANPYAYGQISFIVFGTGLAIVAGDLAYRTTRRHFFLSRRLDEARAELALRNEGLTGKVTYQTNALRRLADQIDTVQEEERQRLARELQEQLGLNIAALRKALETAHRADATLDSVLPGLTALIDEADQTVGRMVSELRSRELEDLGLVPAIQWLAEQAREAGLTVTVDTDDWPTDTTLDDPRTSVALRVLQEAVSNVIEHAAARTLQLGMRVDGPSGSTAVLYAIDDGRGISIEATSSRAGFGIMGMREKVRRAGGQIVITGQPGNGTTVSVELPLE